MSNTLRNIEKNLESDNMDVIRAQLAILDTLPMTGEVAALVAECLDILRGA